MSTEDPELTEEWDDDDASLIDDEFCEFCDGVGCSECDYSGTIKHDNEFQQEE